MPDEGPGPYPVPQRINLTLISLTFCSFLRGTLQESGDITVETSPGIHKAYPKPREESKGRPPLFILLPGFWCGSAFTNKRHHTLAVGDFQEKKPKGARDLLSRCCLKLPAIQESPLAQPASRWRSAKKPFLIFGSCPLLANGQSVVIQNSDLLELPVKGKQQRTHRKALRESPV